MNKKIDKDMLSRILKNHKGDFLSIVFYITCFYYLLYKIVLVNFEAPFILFYNCGIASSELALGYIVSYLFYFMSFIIPNDYKIILANDMLSQRFEKLQNSLNELITDLVGTEDWISKSRNENINLVNRHNENRNVITDTKLMAKNYHDLIEFKPSVLTYHYNLIRRIDDIIISISRYSELIIVNELMHNLYSILESDFHRWIKGLYSLYDSANISTEKKDENTNGKYSGYISHEFAAAITYKLFDIGTRNSKEKNDYIFNARQILNEATKQVEYGQVTAGDCD